MPLFYFDVVDDGSMVSDDWGIELNDMDEAARQAQALIVDIARERLPSDGRKDVSVDVRCDGRNRFQARLTIRGEWHLAPGLAG
ncbi:MAG: DUF6894 family protein [Janthinobacterium lividum]